MLTKNYKNFKLILLIGFLFLIKICFAQLWGGYELGLTNNSTIGITVTVIPVSMIMSQTTDAGGNFQYTLEAANKIHCPQYSPEIDYDATANSDCSSIPHSAYNLSPNASVGFNFDNDSPNENNGQFCYGIYKIIAKWTVNSIDYYDTCWYEQDAGANYDCGFLFVDHVENYPYMRDPPIRSGRGWTYSIDQPAPNAGWGPQIDIAYTHYYLQCWRPYFWDPNRPTRPKEMGTFTFGIPAGNNHIDYRVIPLDVREDCCNSLFPDQHFDNFGIYQDKQNGNLSLNLTIDKDCHTMGSSDPTCSEMSRWADLIYYYGVQKPLLLTILNGSTLCLNNNITVTLNTDPNNIIGYGSPDFLMTVKTGGILTLNPNSLLVANARTALVLENQSTLNLAQGSIIHIKDCASLCNYGANIYRQGQIILEKSRCSSYCTNPGPFYVHDSVQIILQDSAEFQLGDNSTMIFDGPASALILKPNSNIIIGQNSNLVFQNGAHICAQNCSFQSDSTGNPWDGIYLSGGCDTIINCSIINSYNGINVLNKNNNLSLNPVTTQISGCTFSNTTNTQLTTAINISNSNYVLVNNNSFSSSPLTEGWASAILMQYCPAGNLDILDNTIKNVTNGISVIQSSPYIERNIINGQTDGTGVILDNSNGSLKYNTINNFSEALITYYSSDYFFRNNLNYSVNNIADLYQSSAPIIKPIYSGSALMWLGGNNNFNGNSQGPSGYGIGLNDGSLPAIDSGFNNIVLNGSNYMSGDLSQTGVLPATYNFWQDRPPVYSKFAVTNGNVIDTPDYDGSSLPPINGYQLTDIGFGYYDTVCTSGSSNSPGADNLYIQAYTNEASHNYAAAINLYKQIVSTYKTSNLVPAALSRIINCMEKKTSTTTEYSQLQNYMLQIRNNNLISYTVREIAEDFIIKSMVRQNLYHYSINDYDSMYVHNHGNHKGTHALINKLSLLSFYHDTTGNHFNAPGSSNQYKLSLLSLLTGKQLSLLNVNNIPVIPKEFKLYQNYPNPFNPSTKIKYDMPKEGLVKIKIYDIVGREIYSFEEFKVAGSYELQFDGSKYASGVYFYRMETHEVSGQAKDFVAVKKMVLIK